MRYHHYFVNEDIKFRFETILFYKIFDLFLSLVYNVEPQLKFKNFSN